MNENILNNIIAAAIIMIALSSCNSDYTIRQRGYYRIDLPAQEYQFLRRSINHLINRVTLILSNTRFIPRLSRTLHFLMINPKTPIGSISISPGLMAGYISAIKTSPGINMISWSTTRLN